MTLRTTVKRNAKLTLKNNLSIPISVLLISLTIYLAFSYVSLFYKNYIAKDISLSSLVFANVVFTVCVFLSLVIQVSFYAGGHRFYLRFVDNPYYNPCEIFYYFKDFGKPVLVFLSLILRIVFYFVLFSALPLVVIFIPFFLNGFQFSIDILTSLDFSFILLGALMFIISMIFFVIFCMRYFLVFYLLDEARHFSIREIFKLSVKGCKKYKIELFVFYLSIIPSIFSCLLIIPAFYAIPYIKTSEALFAKYILNNLRKNENV